MIALTAAIVCPILATVIVLWARHDINKERLCYCSEIHGDDEKTKLRVYDHICELRDRAERAEREREAYSRRAENLTHERDEAVNLEKIWAESADYAWDCWRRASQQREDAQTLLDTAREEYRQTIDELTAKHEKAIAELSKKFADSYEPRITDSV